MSLKFLSCNQWVCLQSPLSSRITKGSGIEVGPRNFKLPKTTHPKGLSQSLFFAMDQKDLHEVTTGVGQKDGVVIVDHGSCRKESNLLLNDFVLMFKSKTGYPIVEPAHMELAEPSIKDAFDSCSARSKSSYYKPILPIPWKTLASGYPFSSRCCCSGASWYQLSCHCTTGFA